MNKKKLEKIWGSVGFIMHLSQLIEYNIVNIIAGHKFLQDIDVQKGISIEKYIQRANASNKKLHNLSDKKTMGDVVNAAKDVNLFEADLVNKIDHVKSRRDYYAHTFFKEQLFSKDMENNPNILLDMLSQDINEMASLNDQLLAIDIKQREQAKEIKNSFN